MDLLNVLGSKPRLEILHRLSRRDMYVSELIEDVRMDGKTATDHLDVLTEVGILKFYEEGRRQYFALVSDVRVAISPSLNR